MSVAFLTSMPVSAATSAGRAGSALVRMVLPCRLASFQVLTSPMPMMKFFWQLWTIGSSQRVMTGKPSIRLFSAAVEPMPLRLL